VNDLNREVIEKRKPVRRKSGKSNMKIGGGGGGVVEFRSPAEFSLKTFLSPRTC
jgi:hypothetical protein